MTRPAFLPATAAAAALLMTLTACGGGDPEFPAPGARVALRAQAQALQGALPDDVVWISDACCAQDTPEQVLGVVAGLVSVRTLRSDVPVLIDLPHRRDAGAIAERLEFAGYGRVLLVTD